MPKIQLSNNGSIEGPDLKEMPLKDWLAEGERLFGADMKLWKWKCSHCGHVQSISDFLELKKLGIIKAEKDVGTIWDKKTRSPCNYTLGGLFCFAKTFVISESGERIPVFEFAREK